MKKLASILLIFIFSFVMAFSQTSKPIPKVSEKDTLTINVISESPKIKMASDNLSSQLAKNVENQTVVSNELSASIRHVSDAILSYLQYSQTNPSSPPIQSVVLNAYGFTEERIGQVVKRQNRIRLLFYFFTSMYLFVLLAFAVNIKKANGFPGLLSVLILKETIRGIILFFALYMLTTLLVNPQYYDIVVLSKLLL